MDAQNFLQHLFRSIVPVQPDENDDMNDEMPPLEPIVPITTAQSTSSPSAQTPVPTEAHTVYTTNLQTSTVGTSGPDEDEEDSMPELQSVSDSSDEGSDSDRDANEVEMQAVEDDNDSSWTDDDDSEMPGLEPIHAPAGAPRSSNRRARVDDDNDDERDRRHPSQRVGNVINTQPAISASSSSTPTPTPPAPQSLPNVPPPPTVPPPLPRIRATINIPGFLGNAGGPDPFRLFQQRLFQQNRGGAGQPNAPGNNAPPGNLTMPPMFSGFAITLDINGTPVLHHHPADPNGQDFAAFRDFAGLFGLGYPAAEVEDPERAKKLIDGLEEVPVGLVRRLERVGGSGTAEEEAGGSGGDSGCAICWDRLLDGDGDGFGTAEENGDEAKEDDTATPTPAAFDAAETDAHADEAVSASTASKEPKDLTHPKIVSLPCAHVFHASCLLPWFSRPNQTTCPTCRFNIDPENLTYVRRPRPTAPPPAANPAAPTPADPNAVPPAPGAPSATAHLGATPTPVPAPAPIPLGNFGGGVLFADLIQIPTAILPRNANNIPNGNTATNPAGEPVNTSGPPTTEAAELAAVRETIAQRERDMARQRDEELNALLGNAAVPVAPSTNPTPPANAGAGPSAGADAPAVVVENDQEEHPDPPLPALREDAPAPAEAASNTAPAQPQPAGAPPPPPGANTNPNARDNMPGTIHWGFDIFVGTVPPGMDLGMDMDMDDDEFMMDDEMIDQDMEEAWGAALRGENGDFATPPLEPLHGHHHHHHHPAPAPGAVPANGAGVAPLPIPPPNPPPAGAAGNNPHAPFAHFPHQLFPGMNAGRNVHVGGGVGTARTVNDAFASLFGGRGPFGAPPAQGTPAPAGGPQAGAAPQADPASAGGAPPTNAAPNAQANAGPANPQQVPDFFSALLNSVPAGALGRIVPMQAGQPAPPGTAGNGATPIVNAGTQTPHTFPAQAGVNLPPLRRNDAPPAPGANANAGAGTAAPTPAGTAPAGGAAPGPQAQNALPPFANLFGTFPPTTFQNPGGARQRDGNAPPQPFMPRAPRERKSWTLPPAPGPSLRQRIERREREAGLRCYDISCGVGPSDEEPFAALTEAAMKQLTIRPHECTNADASVCSHTFHSSCLVTSERVSLKGGEVNILGDQVEVSCSICRGVGCVSKADWDEGVQALA